MPAFLLCIDRCYPHLQNAALRAAQVFRFDRRAAGRVLSKGRETCFFSLGSFTRFCLRTELHAPSALTSLLLFVLGIIKLLPLKLSLQTLATFFTLFSSWGVPFPESSCAWLALRHFLRGTSSILWQHRSPPPQKITFLGIKRKLLPQSHNSFVTIFFFLFSNVWHL